MDDKDSQIKEKEKSNFNAPSAISYVINTITKKIFSEYVRRSFK